MHVHNWYPGLFMRNQTHKFTFQSHTKTFTSFSTTIYFLIPNVTHHHLSFLTFWQKFCFLTNSSLFTRTASYMNLMTNCPCSFLRYILLHTSVSEIVILHTAWIFVLTSQQECSFFSFTYLSSHFLNVIHFLILKLSKAHVYSYFVFCINIYEL